jgi:hypothetical protein
MILLYLIILCWNFFNQKLKRWIKNLKSYYLFYTLVLKLPKYYGSLIIPTKQIVQ